MALSQSDRDLLKHLYTKLADEPLEPDSPLYEPVYQELGLDDPVQHISTLVDFGGVESIRLFSGFRGSGKTTELLRLQHFLEQQGYFVLYADALNYVNQAEPIEITDLLMVLAGAFSDALEDKIAKNISHETFWDRIWTFLNSEIKLREVGVKVDFETPGKEFFGGVKTGLDLKFELKSGTNFRRMLREALANKLKELKNSVDRFFEDGIKQIRHARGESTQVVFIFDQLEQLRGTLQTEQDVIRSVERIFAIDIDLLRIPYVHAVFTVPPWLKFVLPGTVQVTLLSTVHLWNNDPGRTRSEPAWRAFHSLVKRRLGEEGLRLLFGKVPERQLLVDKLICVCGGHFRDLLRILRDTVIRAASLPDLPVPLPLIENAINAARRDFLPIAQDDANWLAEIARVRATALPSTDSGPVNRLTRFLDSHFVLYFVNSDEWYDIHPLIRDEVAEVVRAGAAGADKRRGRRRVARASSSAPKPVPTS
jgi:hypothetical protein